MSVFECVRDAESTGPAMSWFCACQDHYGNVLRSEALSFCPSCRTLAPWLTWKKDETNVAMSDANKGETMYEITEINNDPGTSWEIVDGVLSITRGELEDESAREIVPILDGDLNPL